MNSRRIKYLLNANNGIFEHPVYSDVSLSLHRSAKRSL